MSKRKNWFYITLGLTLITIALLTTGSPLLELSLDSEDSIPLGNFITWAGMISLPVTVYWGVKELRKPTTKLDKTLGWFLKIIIIFGILWVPISYLLAGNFSFSFSEKETFQGGQTAMLWFWRFSYGIGFGSIITIVIYWTSLLFKRNKTTI